MMGAAGEVQWVKGLVGAIEAGLTPLAGDGMRVDVSTGYKLAYAHEVMRYEWETDRAESRRSGYQTDLLISDAAEDRSWWVPRVVVECKLGAVTTHDALTYSAKAATHKQVHPYLRYGILIGAYGPALPPRLIRHGAYFDFMAAWEDGDGGGADMADLLRVLIEEVRASRRLQSLLTDKSRECARYRLLHRPLLLTPAQDRKLDGRSASDK